MNAEYVAVPREAMLAIVDAISALSQSVAAVRSMASGGEYEDTELWQVDQLVDRLRTLIDGGEDAG